MKLHITKILVDGGSKPTKPTNAQRVEMAPFTMIVSGDGTSAAIACASIVAKVDRDEHMGSLSDKYPVYGFAHHMGYGTKEHNDALLLHGPCREHRLTFSVAGKKIGDLSV
jgi:ribonuclease HII